jgi:cell division protein FtsA
MRQDVICGLDIGSSSIKVVIAEAPDLRNISGKKENVLGFSQSPVKGFSKGLVSGLNLLSDSIEEAVLKAEKRTDCKVRKLIVNISGVHIRNFKSRGSVHISDRPSEITENDIKRCMESARLIAMSLDREVVHMIPEKFYIDDKIEIDAPLGLFGSKLDVDLNIITSLVSILQNLIKAVNMAGYEAEEVILSGAGAALSVFEEKELEEGGVLIDVGKDITETSLFLNGKMRNSFYFPFGGDDLTQILQDNLRITFEEAEELRLKNGIIGIGNRGSYDEGIIQLSSKINISKREISALLFPKAEEILRDVHKKIDYFLKERKKHPHIYVIGGAANMDGLIESVEEIFGMPVNMGTLKNNTDLKDNTFAVALGLVRYEILRRFERRSEYPVTGFMSRMMLKIRSLLGEYF